MYLFRLSVLTSMWCGNPAQAPDETSFPARTRSSSPASVGGTGVKNHCADVVCNILVVQKTQSSLCLRFARAVIHDRDAEEFNFGVSWGTTDQDYLSFSFVPVKSFSSIFPFR